MIQSFVDKFMASRDILRAEFAESKPCSYKDLVTSVIKILRETSDNGNTPDPDRITEIDHGDYQGCLLYIIAANGYQPSNFWAVHVSYGSCSGCDTLQAILDCSDVDEQIDQLMTESLHVVQGLAEVQ